MTKMIYSHFFQILLTIKLKKKRKYAPLIPTHATSFIIFFFYMLTMTTYSYQSYIYLFLHLQLPTTSYQVNLTTKVSSSHWQGPNRNQCSDIVLTNFPMITFVSITSFMSVSSYDFEVTPNLFSHFSSSSFWYQYQFPLNSRFVQFNPLFTNWRSYVHSALAICFAFFWT